MSKIYTYVEKIGKGAEGNIYKVVNKNDLKNYALKDIQKKNLKNISTIRTSSQYQIDLDHPNVAKVKEMIEDETNIVIILELCEEDLSSFLKRKKLTSKEKKNIFKQIVLGLKYIHSKNIIHRDIKPQNILMCKGIPKITDFGLAKKVDPKLKYIKGIAGTPRYLSPEIVRNELYSFSTDIWSLGILFYLLIYNKEFLSELKTFEELTNYINYKDIYLPKKVENKEKVEKVEKVEGIEGIEGTEKVENKEGTKGTKKVEKVEKVENKEKIEGIDLLRKMLNKNGKERISIDEILTHPYFNEIE